MICDSLDQASVAALVQSTAVVISTVGPFAAYGTELVAACAEHGTDYCDITGETGWVRSMITAYHDTAVRTGAKLLFCCGHDSVPWDLTTAALSDLIAAEGDQLAEVTCHDEVVSQPSGGTIATMIATVAAGGFTAEPRPPFDPLLAGNGGIRLSFRTTPVPVLYPQRSGVRSGCWLSPFIMVSGEPLAAPPDTTMETSTSFSSVRMRTWCG